MRELPIPDPGEPDHRSAARYLRWIARAEARTLAAAMTLGVVWMISQALVPAVIGRAIDEGVAAKDPAALVFWSGVVLLLGIVQAVSGICRHRFAVVNFLTAAYLTVQVVNRQATRLGGTLLSRITAGEVVSVGVADVAHVGGAMDVAARGAGSVVAIFVVAGIMLATSVRLGLIVVIGVPVILAIAAPLLRPLHHRQQRQRELTGELNTRAVDIVAGLRVLRGIGGEEVFTGRYRQESQQVRRAGVEVARSDSLLAGAEVLLPGLLVVAVTWLGARYAIAGTISVGELVACYGYAVFLISPMRTIGEVADRVTRAYVSAGRVVRILAMRPEFPDAGTRTPPPGAELTDAASGLVVRPGQITAIAAADPADAQAIADRLGRHADGEVTYGDIPLAEIAGVRRRVLVAVNEDVLFSGRLRDVLIPAREGFRVTAAEAIIRRDHAEAFRPAGGEPGETRRITVGGGAEIADGRAIDRATGRVDLNTALYAACVADFVGSVGLDAWVAEAGREFSGGQQQRLRLARALLADPEVLVLVEPTSAVDAHTEARIAERLGTVRGGSGGSGHDRMTVVCTTSPLVLDRADHVAFVERGKVVAEGTHRDLLRGHRGYAATVLRDAADDPAR